MRQVSRKGGVIEQVRQVLDPVGVLPGGASEHHTQPALSRVKTGGSEAGQHNGSGVLSESCSDKAIKERGGIDQGGASGITPPP